MVIMEIQKCWEMLHHYFPNKHYSKCKMPVSEYIVRWSINNAFPFTTVSIINDTLTLAYLVCGTLPGQFILQRYGRARLDINQLHLTIIVSVL